MVRSRKWLFGLLAGLLGGLALVATSFALMSTYQIRMSAEILADGSTGFVPLPVFSWVTNTFGKTAKLALFAGMLGLEVLAGALLGAVLTPLWDRLAGSSSGPLHPTRRAGEPKRAGIPVLPRPVGVLAAVLATWLAVLALTLLPVWGTIAGPANRSGLGASLAAITAAGLAYAVVAVGAWLLLARPRRAGADARGADAARRQAVTTLGALVLGLYVERALGRLPVARAAARDGARGGGAAKPASDEGAWAREVPNMTLAVTPNPDFYTVSKNVFDPQVDMGRWKLEVTGLVRRPLSLGYDDLQQLPAREQYTTLECIDNRVGGDLISNALWRGLPLADLLRLAEPEDGAVKVVFHAWDDYTDSIPYERALHPDNLLAYAMNGETLPNEHGYPLRLLVPGIYGMKNVKWIHKIELVPYDYRGFWQQRGWSDDATIQTMSRIDVPYAKNTSPDNRWIAGIAFAGNRGISAVEVSTDGGATWRPAQLKDALSPNAWRLWVYPWDATPGEYTLVVRATDGQGNPQPERERDPLPDGATGLHRLKVRIR